MSVDGAAGRLADNMVRFGRTLRRAGLPVGPDRIGDALRAAELVGLAAREDFRAALRTVLVSAREQEAVFDAAFDLFWRSGHLGAAPPAQRPPMAKTGPIVPVPKPGSARAMSALFESSSADTPGDRRPQRLRLAVSTGERLARRDFAQMTVAEVEAAARAVSQMRMPDDRQSTRRFVADRRGAIDPRQTLRRIMRHGGELTVPARRARADRPTPVVALVDISGSMSAYSRIVLHFLHALGRTRRVDVFLFGTRLSNVTRTLRRRDVDAALAACAAAVPDWSGGTRIGSALAVFNRLWARRVLGQGATVLLVTDGLERDGVEMLAAEASRLHRSARRLIWLNPLLGYDGFSARARGIRALLPHVDELRSIHSLDSVAALACSLSGARGDAADPRRFLVAA